MFEFRFFTLIKALLLFACVLGGADYFYKLDKLKTELAEMKTLADTAREAAIQRRQDWTDIKNAKDKLDQLAKREEELLKQRDLLDQKERRLTVEIKYLADSIAATAEKARSSAIGTVIPELKLTGHPTLHNAKIFKITEDSISFLHEDGVANLRATTEELPPDLVQRYDLGPNSITQRLQRLLK